ncbi:TPA: helix-turn-helix domain-containing protein [Enterobacter bugandensis]|uniref:helix-turn-helix domain-containing protein n=1 Tax=Enterobacter bugandensis TaxID=881260 RepID=UPI002005CEA6|nr:helix-turn-helix domain-containing protein [Enterobacter bugandensis]MCK7446038.1 helix-turn-helix domain-containing protein [Enterobacter bugandensis]HCM9243507.1 helix-turn-helix domain-containing protein [Enterobacter bugandensis]
MSVKLSAWVWDGCAAQGVKGIKLLVMARLADFSSDEGVCWPSVATIARQLGAGRSTVITAITDLEKEGWLTRTERRKGQRSDTNLYTLNAQKLRAAAAQFQCPVSERSDSGHPENTGAGAKHGSDSERPDSECSGSERPENTQKGGSEGSESGHDPSITTDPSLKQISSSGNSNESPDQEDLSKKTSSPKKWGTPEDLKCAEWIFGRIRTLYEKAAETDGEVARPKEPNWNAWANEIRLMRTLDGRTHRLICDLFKRVQSDPFWCRNVLSPAKLREKWDELTLKLAPAIHAGVMRTSFGDDYYKNDSEAAAKAGFRV